MTSGIFFPVCCSGRLKPFFTPPQTNINKISPDGPLPIHVDYPSQRADDLGGASDASELLHGQQQGSPRAQGHPPWAETGTPVMIGMCLFFDVVQAAPLFVAVRDQVRVVANCVRCWSQAEISKSSAQFGG